ncbi:nitrate/nitrite transport system permease protein [Marisediminitalea aggregata]|uniref:Nitrate/nitrite transport system permease protein n=2 Tax=Alteromonadaceae TaxID=72275 RepID=A0A1M5R050_9ALTE|nr:ABC transporter permease [Marisediminitalea aggregata]MAP21733.1 ABC transporter permease [Alteromonadaceae bacterium]MEC7470927.1 ABC transporter permease [Pseudomonadota bacterium]HBY38968.1 ABC transporter permease [Alteromonas sp.]MAX41549.1 ABC transporter permease [Alteromonadaceae bacterium]MEC7824704.1 ABC transporter permease [Pseudomonadota bacterium]|tara:strand:+ start:16647 stop:17639 length:993 start_codon:yes stop_codon:yes gene_type:complete
MSKSASVVSQIGQIRSKNVLGSVMSNVPKLLMPVVGLLLFLALWNGVAKTIDTSLGQFPGPAQVWEQSMTLIDEHSAQREKADAFYARQEERNAARIAKDPSYEPKIRPFTGAPTFFDQIWTSLYTVMVGFVIASIVAVPVGILCGLSRSAYSAMNPLIQIFKPVSPLAWLPLVTMVVSAVYVSEDPMFSKSFITSAFTVSLCCLWPTLINTAVGVSNIDSDLVNVSKVLRLKPLSHVQKIVLPASIPMIFTGLRLSLGIGWMVLIAAEMLAQNPGLGKFVWDEFQNGSSESLARIMVAVITIGIIGFLLDRLMLSVQRLVSWDKNAVLR